MGRDLHKCAESESQERIKTLQSAVLFKMAGPKGLIVMWVGRIQYFFEHVFAGQVHKFVCIHWYKYVDSLGHLPLSWSPQIVDVEHKTVNYYNTGNTASEDQPPPKLIQSLAILTQCERVLLGKKDAETDLEQRIVIRLQTSME